MKSQSQSSVQILSVDQVNHVSGGTVMPRIDDPLSGLVLGPFYGSIVGADIGVAPVSLFLGGIEMLTGYNSESVFNYLSLPFGLTGGLVGAVAGIPVGLALGTYAYFKY